jgi:hypothetical protein
MRRLITHPPLALLILASLLFFSHYELLSWSTFSDDDAHVSQLSLSYNWLEPYYKPEVYQQLSIVHFTPIVLSLYRAILITFGVDNAAFVVLQLILISIMASLAAYLCIKITKKFSAGLLCLLLIFSNASLLPMLSRFYTAHYVLGAALTLLSACLIHRAWQQKKLQHPTFLILIFLSLSLALLSKEIYIVFVPILCLLFVNLRAWPALVVVNISLFLYFLLRFSILGTSIEGRDGQAFLTALLSLNLSTWLGFFTWYLTTKWLICVAVLAGLVLSPRKMFGYLILASFFAAPSLAAPHAFQNPQLHGDRLFFMFDIALIIASVLAIYLRTIPVFSVIFLILLGFIYLIPTQRMILKDFSTRQKQTTAYIINKRIEQLTPSNTLVFTPLNYQQGEYMNIHRLLGSPWLKIVQNCRQALKLSNPLLRTTPVQLIAFKSNADQMSRSSLQAHCQSSQAAAVIEQAPTFNKGLLSWAFSIPMGYTGGVLFIDRGIAVNTGNFRQRIVRPKPNERYQIYTRKDNKWWFSSVERIKVPN